VVGLNQLSNTSRFTNHTGVFSVPRKQKNALQTFLACESKLKRPNPWHRVIYIRLIVSSWPITPLYSTTFDDGMWQ